MQKRVINKVIVHVTDSPDSKDFSAIDISRWHQEMGFPKSQTGLFCGYHYVIRRSGEIETARLEHEIGAHCRGHNKNSIGVAWVGRSKIEKPQLDSLLTLVAEICDRYGLEAKQVFGHRELNPGKSCPNIEYLDDFRDLVELAMVKPKQVKGMT